MSDKKPPPPKPPARPLHEGYRPTDSRGYKPVGPVQNGHQPTTSQQGPKGPPPNQGSGGQSGDKK